MNMIQSAVKFSLKISAKQLALFATFICFMLSGCTIEKRRYTSGYHIEGLGRSKSEVVSNEKNTAQLSSPTDTIQSIVEVHVTQTESNERTPIVTQDTLQPKPVKFSKNPHRVTQFLTSEIFAYPLSNKITPTESNYKKRSSVHPDAFTSLMCGIAAMGCLAGIFLTGASPLILFLALLLAMLILAFFATRLAKRAFKDMHYARDRFGGKAMAAVGMLLGVLSIIAFLGLVTIVFLGFAFINLT